MKTFSNRHEHEENLITIAKPFAAGIRTIDSGKVLPELKPKAGITEKLFLFLRDYVGAPTIVDNFKTHSQRIELRIIIESNEELAQWYKSNRLAYNNLFCLGLIVQALPEDRGSKKIIGKLLKKIPNDSESYDKLKRGRKVKLTNEIALLVEELYYCLAEHSK